MLIVENNYIPFKGFQAILLFGVLFVRKGVKITDKLLNHENIHYQQMKELLFIGFYIWYVIEWLIKLPIHGRMAYYNISFERESYSKERDMHYLRGRKFWGFIKYM